MDIGNRVRNARKSLELSQDALARRADVSLSLVNQIERGVITDPHYSTLVGIANALDMSVGELLGEESAVPLAEAPSASPSPETTGAGQTGNLREALRRLQREDPSGLRDLALAAYSSVGGARSVWIGGPTGVRTLQELNVFEREHGVSAKDIVQALAEEFADGNLEHLEKQISRALEAQRELDQTLGVADEETA